MVNTVAYCLPTSFPFPKPTSTVKFGSHCKVDYRSKSLSLASSDADSDSDSDASSTPWLLVHDDPIGNSSPSSIRYHYLRNLHGDTIIKKRDPRLDKVCDRDLPKHLGRYFGCSDNEWVSCTSPPTSNSTYNSKPCDHLLFNILGGDSIPLPAGPIIDHHDHVHATGFPTYGLEKLVMSSSCPYDEFECRLMAIRGSHSKRLATCVPGVDDTWTMLQMEPYKNRDYQDIIYSYEDQCFYAIRGGGFSSPYWIESWDVRNISCPKGNLIRASLDHHHRSYSYIGGGGGGGVEVIQTRMDHSMTEKRYLVESFGDIYLVLRFLPKRFASGKGIHHYEIQDEGKEQLKKCTYVYKLDKIARKWEYVESLVDYQAFFIGANHSFSPEPDYPHLTAVRGNSIYFMDENYRDGHVVGVYNLETGIEEELFSNRNNPTSAPPVWIQSISKSLI